MPKNEDDPAEPYAAAGTFQLAATAGFLKGLDDFTGWNTCSSEICAFH